MKIWPFGKKRNIENPSHAITAEAVLGIGSSDNISVTESTAMNISATLGCVRILAESVASLSWLVYERQADGGKRRASEHPAYYLLHIRPNSIQSSFALRERLMKDVLLTGNGYLLVDRESGYPSALWPLNPHSVTPQIRIDGKGLRYKIQASTGGAKYYNEDEVIHITCLGDGIVGRSVLSYNATSFSTAFAEEQYAHAFFRNGAYAGGVLQYPKTLSPEAKKRLSQNWQSAYGHSGGWHRVAVLEDGMEWKPMTVNPRDAMALESRKYQVTDIARMFRVPPHMLAELERATFSNIEHQSLEFVIHSLRPWLVRIEQELNYKLFGRSEKYFSEFLLDSLLRGDVKSRNDAYSTMRQNGIINANEWRALENMNPLPGAQGEKYIVQLNMQELDTIGGEDET